MANLATAISSAISKSLLANLPAEASTKFGLNEEEFKEFLQGFLTGQLGKAKAGRASGPKGKNGKGRISGYILFSNANRQAVKEANPDLKFTEVGKELGRLWGELSDSEKESWKNRSEEQNVSNGLPTPTPAAPSGKRSKASRDAPEAAEAAASGEMKITRHGDSKTWVVQGTTFVVPSAKKKEVVGKLRGTKVVALSAADVKKCESNGWPVRPAPAKSS